MIDEVFFEKCILIELDFSIVLSPFANGLKKHNLRHHVLLLGACTEEEGAESVNSVNPRLTFPVFL